MDIIRKLKTLAAAAIMAVTITPMAHSTVFLNDSFDGVIDDARNLEYLKLTDERVIGKSFNEKLFASKNRSIIIERICNEIGGEFNQNKIIESIHNYIDFDKLILRKGAISAEKDKLCIISLNMRDGILICKGKGNPEWNYSSAHGCGRLMSRKDARLTFNMKQYKEDMKDVYSSCICKETLDEIPEYILNGKKANLKFIDGAGEKINSSRKYYSKEE